MSSHGGNVRIVKKYGNRRLYDTSDSRYVTLEELAVSIKAGAEVRVTDAQTGHDLTQNTLAQIILEGRGAAQFLSVPILTQLVRMNDDALADFFGRWLSAALELYQGARQGVQALTPYNPLAAVPFAASNAIARLFTALPGPWMSSAPASSYATRGYAPTPPSEPPPPDYPPPTTTPPPPPGPDLEALASLRRELNALKQALGAHSAPPRDLAPAPATPTPPPPAPRPRAAKPAAKPVAKPAAAKGKTATSPKASATKAKTPAPAKTAARKPR